MRSVSRLEFICAPGLFRAGTFGAVTMLDLVFVAAGFGFFAVTLFYTHLCDRI